KFLRVVVESKGVALGDGGGDATGELGAELRIHGGAAHQEVSHQGRVSAAQGVSARAGGGAHRDVGRPLAHDDRPAGKVTQTTRTLVQQHAQHANSVEQWQPIDDTHQVADHRVDGPN